MEYLSFFVGSSVDIRMWNYACNFSTHSRAIEWSNGTFIFLLLFPYTMLCRVSFVHMHMKMFDNIYMRAFFFCSLVIDSCLRKNGIFWLNNVNNSIWTVLRRGSCTLAQFAHEICSYDFLIKQCLFNSIYILLFQNATNRQIRKKTVHLVVFTWKSCV